MPEPEGTREEDAPGLVQASERIRIPACAVRMARWRKFAVARVNGLRLDRGSPRKPELREGVCHAEKLSPQEQWATAFGLVTLNPPF